MSLHRVSVSCRSTQAICTAVIYSLRLTVQLPTFPGVCTLTKNNSHLRCGAGWFLCRHGAEKVKWLRGSECGSAVVVVVVVMMVVVVVRCRWYGWWSAPGRVQQQVLRSGRARRAGLHDGRWDGRRRAAPASTADTNPSPDPCSRVLLGRVRLARLCAQPLDLVHHACEIIRSS